MITLAGTTVITKKRDEVREARTPSSLSIHRHLRSRL